MNRSDSSWEPETPAFRFPLTRSTTIAARFAELARRERSRQMMVEDPMTEAIGAPVGEFFEEWDRLDRHTLCDIAEEAERLGEREVLAFARNSLERWMP